MFKIIELAEKEDGPRPFDVLDKNHTSIPKNIYRIPRPTYKELKSQKHFDFFILLIRN